MDHPTPPPQQPANASGVRRHRLLGIAIAVLSLAALCGLVWYLTHAGNGQDGEQGKGKGASRRGSFATTVGVATVERADFPVIMDALGTVTPIANATVRAQVGGVLQQVLFTEGQLVKAGQLLAVIDPRPFDIAIMQAAGMRERDEAQLDNARVTLQRYRSLLEQDSIAHQDVDTQSALVKQLEGTVMVDRAAERSARLNLEYSRVVAPISGRAGLRTADVGNVVSSSDVNGLVVITQIAPIDVQFAVPQDRVPELRSLTSGVRPLEVNVFDRTRSVSLATGRFLALDNQVDTQTGTVRAKGRFDNSKVQLFPNQFVNVRVLLRTIAGATAIPVAALRHGSSGDYVYVLNAADKTVALRPVQRGVATVDKVQIISGVESGEQVITEGADRLSDGARVSLPGARPAGAAAQDGVVGQRRHRPPEAGTK